MPSAGLEDASIFREYLFEYGVVIQIEEGFSGAGISNFFECGGGCFFIKLNDRPLLSKTEQFSFVNTDAFRIRSLEALIRICYQTLHILCDIV